MNWLPFLKSVNNKTIQFASFRPLGSTSALIDRKIKVVGPDSVLQLIQEADTSLLPVLIDLLKDPEKAFAAEIILTALVSGNGKIIEAFFDNPEEWWKTFGINAYRHWSNWYEKNQNNIEWNQSKEMFVTAQVKD